MELELVPKDNIDRTVANQPSDENELAYTGPERRKKVRRITVDRREMVRFETKPDRRSGGDRRIATKMWDGRDI
ncbi:hypothetical protein [Kaarinaea lacus]